MLPEERVELQEICKRISEEQDPGEFQRLVGELVDMLDQANPNLTSTPSH
jgi:hypothetical protein